MATNDWTLLDRWTRERDAEAFADLAGRYAGVVYGACRRILGDGADAEDAAQECFLTLAQTRVPPSTNLGAWLHRVAVNKARDRAKAAARRRERERRYMAAQPTETIAQWREIETLVDESVAELPAEIQEAVVAHFMAGESHAVIAEQLGVSRQTVTYRVGKGVEAIRESLRKKGLSIAVAALATALTENLAEAAPARLVSSVGKMAVSGVPAAGGVAALTGAVTLKFVVLGVSVCAMLYAGFLVVSPFLATPDDSPAIVAAPDPATPSAPPNPALSATGPTPAGQVPKPPPTGEFVHEPEAKPDRPTLAGASGGGSDGSQFRVRVTNPNTDLQPLPIELPKQHFGGTPLDYFSENLETPRSKLREPFLAPAGATNLALDKPVTSSDPDPVYGSLAMVTDGEKGYQQEHVVEVRSGKQWIQLDLGQESEIYAVVIWHWHASERVYFDVAAMVSDEPGFGSESHLLFNNDYDDTLGFGPGKDHEYIETYEGRLIDAKGVRARYIRLYSNGNTTDDRNHYVEVEVYGRPVAAGQTDDTTPDMDADDE